MGWFFIAEINDILDDEPPQAHKTLIFFYEYIIISYAWSAEKDFFRDLLANQ